MSRLIEPLEGDTNVTHFMISGALYTHNSHCRLVFDVVQKLISPVVSARDMYMGLSEVFIDTRLCPGGGCPSCYT